MMNSLPSQANSNLQQRIFQRREKDFKLDARLVNEIRNSELINKKLLMHKKAVLPRLHSNNAKNSINIIGSPHKQGEYSPVKRYEHPQYSDKQALIFYNQAEIYASRMQKILSRRQDLNEANKQKKIGKSFSQVKGIGHFEQLSNEAVLAMRKSQRTCKMVTEESATSTSSKQIYQRLNRLRNKDKIMTIQQPKESLQKDSLKEYKHSSFVLKFKVAQSHHQEKQQLKSVKNSRNDNPVNHLKNNIKIKNYTKFFFNQPIN